MIGNIFSGLLSVMQGDDPDEILKKQAMTTLMGGMAPTGVDSAGAFAPHLAQTGAEQAASNIAEQSFTGAMGDALGGVGDSISEFGTEINDFTGMENKDWTKLGIQGGVGAMSAPPKKAPPPAAMGQGISKPMGNTPSNQASLLSSNPAAGQAGGQQLTPEEIMKLKQQGLL
jgi:hypothetical protein